MTVCAVAPVVPTPPSNPSCQPTSGSARSRRIRRAGGGDDPLVVSANPGCAMHLGAAGLNVRHPAELLADALEEQPRG